MEQQLNQFNDYEYNYYKIEYENQKVQLLPEFKIWYEKVNKYISEENERRGSFSNNNTDNSLLLLSFCKKCKCYVICSCTYDFSFVECSKCNSSFCIGCFREKLSNNDESLCLKGYFKLLYIRTIYRRAGRLAEWEVLNIICSILCILFTPCYLGLVSNIIGLQVHQNPNGTYNSYFLEYFDIICIYSLFRGILMLPYILLFFPFTVALLIPSFFIPKYFFVLNALYTSAIDPTYYRLEIDN